MKSVVFIFLLYFVGIFAFLGSNLLLTIMHYMTLLIGITSFIIFICKYRWSHVTFYIFLFTICMPIYASIQSYKIFGQPFFMGFVSLRYIWFIFFGYFLLLIKYDYRLLIKQINNINLFVAIFSIIAILILGISPGTIYSYEVSNNVLNVDAIPTGESSGVGGINIRGIRFSACSGFMFISLIYFLISSLKYGGKRNWISFIILITYILFVHKGRQPVALVGIVFVIYLLRMKGIPPKRVVLFVFPVVCAIFLIAFDETILYRFTTILDGEKSADFSTLARIREVEQIYPYILEYPILGVGNLSAHFGWGGFQTFFGPQFYLADIGAIAVFARGGIILALIYLGLYVSLYKKTKCIEDKNVKQFMRYMLLSYALLLTVMFSDILSSTATDQFALIFYPLFRKCRNNMYIHKFENTRNTRYLLI